MTKKFNLSTTLFVLGLLAAGCVAETSGGGTDSSSHWFDRCGQDSDCGGSLSCQCNVCTRSCSDGSECSSLGTSVVCTDDWASCGTNAPTRICAPERADSGRATDTPAPETESDSPPPTESTTEPTETTETESDPSEASETTSDASTTPTGTTSDAGTNQPDSDPTTNDALDAGPSPDDTSEADISVCSEDDECIVVDYAHCCGATKRAINAAYEDEYALHPQWQSYFEDGPCATIGICRDDSSVTSAQCARNGAEALGYCSLVFAEPALALSGEACQANTECATNVCVRTAGATGAFGELECAECLSEGDYSFACDEDADCCGAPCCLGCGEREGLCLQQ